MFKKWELQLLLQIPFRIFAIAAGGSNELVLGYELANGGSQFALPLRTFFSFFPSELQVFLSLASRIIVNDAGYRSVRAAFGARQTW